MVKYSICTDTSVALWENQYVTGTLLNCKLRWGKREYIANYAQTRSVICRHERPLPTEWVCIGPGPRLTTRWTLHLRRAAKRPVQRSLLVIR